ATIDADRVQSAVSDSGYDVRALRRGAVVRSVRFPATAPSCNGGWLTSATNSGGIGGSGNMILGREGWTVMLRTTADGSLVVNRVSSTAGLLLGVAPI